MNLKSDENDRLWLLRLRAEAVLALPHSDLATYSTRDLKYLIHELQIQQVELELQNEELRQSQIALEESRDAYKDLFEFAPVGYFTLDQKGDVLAANLTGASLLGVDREALIGQPFATCVAADSQKTFQLHCLDILERSYVRGCEVQIVRHDGTVVDALLEGLAIDQYDGDYVTDYTATDSKVIRLALSDNSERKQAERSSTETAQQLRIVVSLLPHGILLLDHERHILLSNTIAESCLAQLAEFEPEECLHKLGNEPLVNILARHTEQNPIEIVLEDPSRQEPTRVFEVKAQPVDLVLDQWVLVIAEVTEQRQAEEALHTPKHRMLNSHPTAGFSHELTDILQVICSYSGLLQRQSDLSPLAQKRINIIQKYGRQAADLLHQSIDLSDISLQTKKPIDLKIWLVRIVAQLQQFLPEAIKLTLETSSTDEAFNVEANSVQLQQVLLNLVLNARDAMPGGGTLTFQLSRLYLPSETSLPSFPSLPSLPSLPSSRMLSGRWIVLNVNVSGIGILTAKEKGIGSGLALSQSQDTIQRHGGTLLIDNQRGQGTTTTIHLPELVD